MSAKGFPFLNRDLGGAVVLILTLGWFKIM